MGSYKLIITDYDERPCDVEDCSNLANQYTVTVKDTSAKVEKYCTKHQNTREASG